MDQDATYKDYIAVHWPEIKILYNTSQFWCLAYAWKRYLSKEELRYFEGEFMKNEIIKDHGPLLEKYYSYGDGQKQVGDDEHVHGDSTRLVNAQWGTFNQFDFISEGDSPAFLFLLSNGLNDVSHPEYGGWGGRFVAAKEKPYFFADGDEATDFNPLSGQADKIYPQSRWIKVLQEDFAARADWCIKPYAKANHPPVVHIKGDANRIAKPGSEVRVAINSEDPDGDKVTIRVWPYAEAGNGAVEVSYEEGQIKVKIPSDAAIGNQYHVVIEGKDNGEKPITQYARLVLSVSGLN